MQFVNSKLENEIQSLIDNSPKSWKKLFISEGLGENPKVRKVLKTLLEKTAGGKDAGNTGEFIYKVPQNVRTEAMKGIRLSHEHNYSSYNGIGLTRAIQLVIVEKIPERSAKRMYNFFNRNQRYKTYKGFNDDINPSRSYLSWLDWGGTSGNVWINKIFKK